MNLVEFVLAINLLWDYKKFLGRVENDCDFGYLPINNLKVNDLFPPDYCQFLKQAEEVTSRCGKHICWSD
jgi:hypothetical protein